LSIRIVFYKLLYDKLYFRAVFVTKTISTSTWDCTPDRIYGEWMNEWMNQSINQSGRIAGLHIKNITWSFLNLKDSNHSIMMFGKTHSHTPMNSVNLCYSELLTIFLFENATAYFYLLITVLLYFNDNFVFQVEKSMIQHKHKVKKHMHDLIKYNTLTMKFQHLFAINISEIPMTGTELISMSTQTNYSQINKKHAWYNVPGETGRTHPDNG
jgi:hypothetical protein